MLRKVGEVLLGTVLGVAAATAFLWLLIEVIRCVLWVFSRITEALS